MDCEASLHGMSGGSAWNEGPQSMECEASKHGMQSLSTWKPQCMECEASVHGMRSLSAWNAKPQCMHRAQLLQTPAYPPLIPYHTLSQYRTSHSHALSQYRTSRSTIRYLSTADSTLSLPEPQRRPRAPRREACLHTLSQYRTSRITGYLSTGHLSTGLLLLLAYAYAISVPDFSYRWPTHTLSQYRSASLLRLSQCRTS
eukprot:719212-Rhodomonas_salina.2